MPDYCIVCGVIVPEGTQICPSHPKETCDWCPDEDTKRCDTCKREDKVLQMAAVMIKGEKDCQGEGYQA